MRCMYEMGEFGNLGMQVCVNADQEAVDALKHYPPEADAAIARCFQSLWTRGYAVVQQCVDAELGTK